MSAVSSLKSISGWSKAGELAEKTPETRNRYVDFLRAASIIVVVMGHWMMAAPYIEDGSLKLDNMLRVSPWMQWLTWVCQVMPIFFIVGGFSNGISWESALRAGRSYRVWLATRLARLFGPVTPLLVVWTVMAMVAHRFGVRPDYIKVGSQVALIPTWFLAVYVMVVALTPVTYGAWKRFGTVSFWTLVLGVVTVDAVAHFTGVSGLRWINYAFVWLSVHQLGYMWRDGHISGPKRGLPVAAAGLALLIFLIVVVSYPVSMISVPGQEISNSRPPTVALFALAVMQFGLVLTVEKPIRHRLDALTAWTATVFVNGIIMTVYLWHNTAMVLMIGLANILGGISLKYMPGTPQWWAFRPVKIVALACVLFLFLIVFVRYEQKSRTSAAANLPVWRSLGGAITVCAGLALLSIGGIWTEGVLGIKVGLVAMTLAGTALVLAPSLSKPRSD